MAGALVFKLSPVTVFCRVLRFHHYLKRLPYCNGTCYQGSTAHSNKRLAARELAPNNEYVMQRIEQDIPTLDDSQLNSAPNVTLSMCMLTPTRITLQRRESFALEPIFTLCKILLTCYQLCNLRQQSNENIISLLSFLLSKFSEPRFVKRRPSLSRKIVQIVSHMALSAVSHLWLLRVVELTPIPFFQISFGCLPSMLSSCITMLSWDIIQWSELCAPHNLSNFLFF